MPETFIIDGYNVLRRVLSAEDIARDLAVARRAFESLLGRFRRARGAGTRLHLVYDGDSGWARAGKVEKGFEIQFSRPPRTADDVVLDLARRLEGEPGLHVVTSDFTDIGSRLRGLRLKHLTAEEFAACLRQALAGPTGDKPEETGEKPGAISASEVKGWLEEFGFGEGGKRD